MHHLFSSTKVENWILFKYVPMVEAWNVKYLSEEVCRILEASSFLWMYVIRRGAEELYKLTLIEYLVYRIIDVFAYFLNFKTEHYWYVAMAAGLIVGIIHLKKEQNKL